MITVEDELEEIRKEAVMAFLKYYLSIYVKKPQKTTKKLSQDSNPLGR
jgi:vesicle coat complex subunit